MTAAQTRHVVTRDVRPCPTCSLVLSRNVGQRVGHDAETAETPERVCELQNDTVVVEAVWLPEANALQFRAMFRRDEPLHITDFIVVGDGDITLTNTALQDAQQDPIGLFCDDLWY